MRPQKLRMGVKKDTMATKTKGKLFSAAERDAMTQRAKEVKAARGGQVDFEGDVLEKLKSMGSRDRTMGQRLHAVIKAAGPDLTSRLYYGMPAYAKDGKVVCWFKPAEKFKTRYATIGFSDAAKLDDGGMWPTEYAVTQLTPAEESKVTALIKKAVS